jgi:putative SOS response-associated peptidase YedK
MLTVNADEHPLMKRFHRPGAEKRSVVIIPPAEYEDWLSCKSTDEARSFLQLYPADAMHAEPFPLEALPLASCCRSRGRPPCNFGRTSRMV